MGLENSLDPVLLVPLSCRIETSSLIQKQNQNPSFEGAAHGLRPQITISSLLETKQNTRKDRSIDQCCNVCEFVEIASSTHWAKIGRKWHGV